MKALTQHRLIFLTILSTLLFLSDDFLQKIYTANNHAELELNYVLAMAAFSAGLWCTGQRWFVMPILLLFASMQLLQLSHISYIGQPLSPVDISRLYSEWGEVSGVLGSAFADHWPVLLAWGIPYTLLFGLFWRYLPQTASRGAWLAMLLVIVALGSKPDRAVKRDMIFFMPGPTRSSLHNSLNAFSYYAMRMSFGRDRVTRPVYVPYRVEPLTVAERPDRIWVILGESVRSDRLSVYGYERDTSPHLVALQHQGLLDVVPGQAASVATGSTIPLLINGVDEPGNIDEITRKTANLFKLAHASGYSTFWVSAQESKLMSDIGEKWLDRHSTREDAPVQYAQKGDRAILERLTRVATSGRSFGVIQTRATHIPYEEAYAHDAAFQVAWPDSASLDINQRQSNRYDNALRYFDSLVVDVMAMATRLPGRTLVIVTSDHGQMLGDQGRWGHNVLTPQVAAVPMLLFSTDGKSRWPREPVFSHNELHGWLASQIGWRVINPNAKPGISWFHGNNPYGDNLFVKITQALWSEQQLVSRLESQQSGSKQ